MKLPHGTDGRSVVSLHRMARIGLVRPAALSRLSATANIARAGWEILSLGFTRSGTAQPGLNAIAISMTTATTTVSP